MYVVIGASGKLGIETCRRLREEGREVKAIVRTWGRSPELLSLGCDVVVMTLDDAEDLARHLEGAEAAQLICPLDIEATDLLASTRRLIDILASAARLACPGALVAISDYGAHLHGSIGITGIFRTLEQELAAIGQPVTYVRSAEHMQNWTRLAAYAAKSGLLPTYHVPPTKAFPTVSAGDVGRVSADMLMAEPPPASCPRIVQVEGPRRYSADDIAFTLGHLLVTEIEAIEVAGFERQAQMIRGGLSESYAHLLGEMFDAHNEGRIDAEPGIEIIKTRTDIETALKEVLRLLKRARMLPAG